MSRIIAIPFFCIFARLSSLHAQAPPETASAAAAPFSSPCVRSATRETSSFALFTADSAVPAAVIFSPSAALFSSIVSVLS